MNRKGFTLVELLVAVVILGIISGMSIPVIRNIQLKNENRKFQVYGDSLISAAKLYRDSYEQDLFGHHTSGCALISYEELVEKNLLKDFPDSNVSCNDEHTLVRVVKINNKYGYSYQLYCGGKDSNGKALNPSFKSSSLSKRVDKFLKNNETDIDENDDGFTDSYCNLKSDISITAEPIDGKNPAIKYDVLVKVTSMTGLNVGSKLEYSWVSVDNKDSKTVDFSTISKWKSWAFKLESDSKQKEKILSVPSIPIVVSRTLTTPTTDPGFYLLVLKTDNLKDLAGEVYSEEETDSPYKIFGVYNVGVQYTLTYNSQGGSSCSSKTVWHEKNGNEKWGVLCSPKRVGYTFLEWNTKADGTGTKIESETLATSNLKVYAQWRKNQVKIKLDSDGGVLASEHGASYTLNGNQVLRNGSDIIHAIDYDGALGNDGLANWNNSNYLNLVKNGYSVKNKAEWINENKSYDQAVSYNGSDFCDAKNEDCEVTLKVNWVMNKPNKPSIINPSGGGWTRNDFALTVSTNTTSDIIGYWYYSYNNSNFTRYDESYGKSSYVTLNFTKERDQDVYIRVCNKNASGPNDNANCSNSATTRIRIDKTPPILRDRQWNWIRIGKPNGFGVVVDVTANWTWYDPIPASNTYPSGIKWIYQRYAAKPSCDLVPDNPNNEAYIWGNDCSLPCCNQKFYTNQYLQEWSYESWGGDGWYHLQAEDHAGNVSEMYDSYVFHENRDK